MIYFIIGLFVGVFIGMLVMSLCIAAKNRDEIGSQMSEHRADDDKN